MTPTADDSQVGQLSQVEFQELLHEKLRQAVQVTLVALLEEEVTAFVGAAPYQRTAQRRDSRNGSYDRDLGTSVGTIEDLPVPRTRKGFKTQLFERYQHPRASFTRWKTSIKLGRPARWKNRKLLFSKS